MNRRSFLTTLGLAATAGIGSIFAARNAGASNTYYDGPLAENFNGREFFNPGGVEPRGFLDLLKWQFGGGKKAWPSTYESPFASAKPTHRVDGADLIVTMVGHATLLIQTGGLNFLTDPVWAERASPVTFAGPQRRNKPGIALGDLPPIDVVLLSHNHYDHMDMETITRLVADHNPLIITPLGNDTILQNAKIKAQVKTGNWGDVVALEAGAHIHFEPMHHWSARGSTDRRKALWAAFVIETPFGKIYHIGDTGFHGGKNYREAARKHGSFRLAILPIGAYEPRWFMEAQHQNPDEAVRGHLLCNAAHSIGHHWGTFRLTNEGVEQPLEALATGLENHGVEPGVFRPMRPGEVWSIPQV